MPTDIRAVLDRMVRDGTVARVARDRAAQFGAPNRVYLGATIMPEREVQRNMFRDDSLRFRSNVALDSTRYSPVQKRGNVLVASVAVELMDSDVGSDLTADAYDALIDFLERNADMDAMAAITRWQDEMLNRPLLEKNELYRWQAIVDAVIVRHGSDGFVENVPMPNPSGHRVTAGGAWSNNTYDPMPDLTAGLTLLSGKGYTVGRMIAGTPVINKLLNNEKMRARSGGAVITAAGNVVPTALSTSLDALNALLGREGLPPIERYDRQFATPTGTQFFLPRNALVMVAATGRNEEIDLGDTLDVVEDTIGYIGVGRAAGQPTPGRVARMEHFENKPPRIEGEAWQTSGPVLSEPEAMFVIKGIS